MKFYTIREQSGELKPLKIEIFEDYFKLFEKKYLSYTSTHGHLIQSPFFSKLYKQWLVDNKPYFFEQEYLMHITNSVGSPFFEKCLNQLFEEYNGNVLPIAQKIIECLAIHRSLTEEQIYEHLNSKQKELEEKFGGRNRFPAITKEDIVRTIDQYTLNKNYVQYEFQVSEDDKIMKNYVKFLSHLIVVKLESPDGPRYELSLLGILIILAVTADPRQKMFHVEIIDNKFMKTGRDLISFHNYISQAYSDKLPLIFKKWTLFSGVNQYAHQWFFPVLRQTIGDVTQYESVPVTLGGIKEYQDCMHGITFYTTTQLFKIYQGLSSTLSIVSNDNQNGDSETLSNNSQSDDSKVPLINIDSNSDISLALYKKEKELASFLKYADLGRFVDRLEAIKVTKQIDQLRESIYNTELPIIEDVLKNEITFSYYVNLIKSEYINYIDEDKYFIGDERNTEYKDTNEYHILRPADFLRTILKSDREIKKIFLGWMSDIIKYQQHVGEHANEFYENIKKWKSIK